MNSGAAFRDAKINVLSHRDYYDKGARSTIELFKDRVEITNPVGLVSAINQKDFGTRSYSRNPLIFGLFERIDLVEQIRSGIGRIKDNLKENGLSDPEFKFEVIFFVVFYRKYKET